MGKHVSNDANMFSHNGNTEELLKSWDLLMFRRHTLPLFEVNIGNIETSFCGAFNWQQNMLDFSDNSKYIILF